MIVEGLVTISWCPYWAIIYGISWEFSFSFWGLGFVRCKVISVKPKNKNTGQSFKQKQVRWQIGLSLNQKQWLLAKKDVFCLPSLVLALSCDCLDFSCLVLSCDCLLFDLILWLSCLLLSCLYSFVLSFALSLALPCLSKFTSAGRKKRPWAASHRKNVRSNP